MKKVFCSLVILFAGLSADFSRAEDLQKDEYDLKYLVSDIYSPVSTKADRILYPGALLTALSLVYEKSSNEDLQKSINNAKPLGKFSRIGDISGQLVPNALYALGMLGAYSISDDADVKIRSLHRAFFMFETSLYAGLTTTILKTVIPETRPNLADRHAFPSGHSTTAFAFAGVVGLEHEWYYGIPAYVLASYVAFSRLNDNAHYLHDTIAGATVGLSYAFGIWYNRHAPSDSHQSLFILPTDDLSGSVVNWQYRF